MRTLLLLACFLLLAGCGERTDSSSADVSTDLRLLYPDIIDHHGVPVAAEDWELMPFADKGAWFGFALPPEDRPDLAGGFTGPFLMSSGRWLAPQLVRLQWPAASGPQSTGLPGSLVQASQADGLLLMQRLWFDSSRTVLLRSRIHNVGRTPQAFRPAWRGSVFPDMASLEPVGNGIQALAADGTRICVVADRFVSLDRLTDEAYRLQSIDPVTIAPGDSLTLMMAITVTMAGDPEPDAVAALAAADQSSRLNTERWNGYLGIVPDDDAGAGMIAVKSIQTLTNNWRAAAGRMRHGGLFPSSNVWYFNGFWAWDSWKHAVGLARFDAGIAAEQMRLMFDHQDDLGMVADVVYLDPNEDNWRDTKPPLAGWALEVVYEQTGDLDLVRDLYLRLVAFHEFWYAHRDHDGDGLCEYGSTDGTLVAARWESGMDNAVRFDHTGMRQNGPRAWSMDQESVDLNSYLYRDKLALSKLAAALGETDAAERWTTEAAALGETIRTAMFDDETGWFYDIQVDTGEFIPVQGPEGWTPLWAGLATQEQAARLRETMLDTTKFRTHVPFPTVARDHPDFSDGYWRGLVWLDQVYFAIEGLRSYGYDEDADALTRQVFANLEGVSEPGRPLRENYAALTGEGRNVKHFSWTAAHLLLLVLSSR